MSLLRIYSDTLTPKLSTSFNTSLACAFNLIDNIHLTSVIVVCRLSYKLNGDMNIIYKILFIHL